MGIMQKLGGRKFLLAIACILVAVAMELKGPKGLTVELAGFMTAMVGLFSAANTAATKHYLGSQEEAPSSKIESKLDDVHDMMKQGMSPEAVQGFTELLLNINRGLNDVKVAQAAAMNLRK